MTCQNQAPCSFLFRCQTALIRSPAGVRPDPRIATVLAAFVLIGALYAIFSSILADLDGNLRRGVMLLAHIAAFFALLYLLWRPLNNKQN